MLLSLFESQDQDPEKQREDNLDGLFDDDDDEEGGQGYIEPEEDENMVLENSGTGAESEHNRSKTDLEGEISKIPGHGSFFASELHATWSIGRPTISIHGRK